MDRTIIQDLRQVEKPARVALGIFITIAVALEVWGVEELLRFQPSLRWPTVSGVILESKFVRVNPDFEASGLAMIFHNHVHHYADVSYRYAINGREYVSSQISLWSSDLSGGSGHPRAFVDAHPAGSAVLVYYEPSCPQNSVLIPGADKILDPALILGGPVVIGLGLISYYDQVRIIRRKYKSTRFSGVSLE
jgi:hypothetical protein